MRKVTLELPSFALDEFILPVFNAAYYWAGLKNAETRLIKWERYLKPLTTILDLNFVDGRRGFAQF